VTDQGWTAHLSRNWKPDRIRGVLGGVPELAPQDEEGTQRPYKLSYRLDLDADTDELLPRIHGALASERLWYTLVFSHGCFLDVLPYRGGKGKAIRYLSHKWSIPLDSIITAGNSGNDRDMLTGSLRGIVVGNHESELASLRRTPHIYFAREERARGVIEGLERYLENT